MSVLNENQLLGAPPSGQYQIQRSLRFNSSDSAYLSRTPSVAGNRKTWTWSGWVKRGLPAQTLPTLFGTFDSNGSTNGHILYFDADKIVLGYCPSGAFTIQSATTAVFRDYSAWYHIVAAFDTTQAVASDRYKLYVNGVQQTVTNLLWAQNTDYLINFNALPHSIGRAGAYAGSVYLSGYLADIHFIDGQALTPSSFGETDANGEWQPKAYTGSYGTNGFKLDFADNSAATAAALGKDTSGNGNNWTPNNLSVTAGAGNDSLVDTPTSYGTDTGVGGEVRGNYCTWNPLAVNTLATLSNGNLDAVITGSSSKSLASVGVSSGKWYWEVTPVTGADIGFWMIGVAATSVPLNTYPGQDALSFSWYASAGTKINNNNQVAYASYTTNDVIGVALDLTAQTLTFYKNGVSQGVAYTGLPSDTYTPTIGYRGTFVANFGQRPFAYTAPSGFKALCDTNLTAGTITTSGSFTGNANADGPFIWLNGVPVAMSINGNSVTFGTHADKLANGFKLRTNSVSYNLSGTNNFSVTATGDKFKFARAQANP